MQFHIHARQGPLRVGSKIQNSQKITLNDGKMGESFKFLHERNLQTNFILKIIHLIILNITKTMD